MVDSQLVQEPVVERAMDLVFLRAERMRHALDGVFEPVRPVVHRVDAPLVALAVVLGVEDAVHDRVAHDHVRRRHVDLRAERPGAVGEFAGAHPREEVQVLLDAPVAVGALRAGL